MNILILISTESRMLTTTEAGAMMSSSRICNLGIGIGAHLHVIPSQVTSGTIKTDADGEYVINRGIR